VGVSNETSYGVCEFVHAAKTAGLPRIQTIQNCEWAAVGSGWPGFFLWVTKGGGGGAHSHRLATHSNQASPTARGPRQSLTSKIRLTPLSQEVPSARTKIAWELNPHTSYSRPGVHERVADEHSWGCCLPSLVDERMQQH
jgi:hypothetical protein